MPEIVIVPDRAALARAAAQRFVTLARGSIAGRGRFSVVLSGGSTPRDLYVQLASPEFSPQVDWTRVHLFWGDERAVPPDHPESNYRMAYETFLSRVKPPAQNIHRILAEEKPADAARAYEETLRQFFANPLPIPPSPPLRSGDLRQGRQICHRDSIWFYSVWARTGTPHHCFQRRQSSTKPPAGSRPSTLTK